jgi:PKD repeat protein
MLFTVTVTGTAPLTYQWYVDTGAVAGANANSYTISSVTTSNAGNYYVKVTNQCGTATSSTKTLTVHTAPVITSQTTSDTICENQSMVFNVTTTGTTPITYQWYKNSTALTGATNNIYMIASADTLDAGTYYAIATNSCGNDQSSNIVLTVDKLAQITYQSGDSSRCEGESMTFAVQATGTAPLAYQWYKSGVVIQGATASTYALNNVSNTDAGYYHCTISNSCNATATTNKILTVHNNPQPTLGNDTTFCDGGSVTLTPGYGYNCIWNNGSFNNQLTVTQSGSYWVNVTDQYGCSGISDTVNVNVILPYSGQQICMAGVDSATQKNIIVWEKTPNQGITAFNIYKESSTTGVWNLVETKPYDSLSVVYDMSSNPVAHADRYAITVVDSCGNESPRSAVHKTMHLAVSPAVPSGYNLTWNGYEGFTPASYRIWKADTSMKWVLVDSVNANIYMWHDTTSIQAPFWYQIEVLRPGGACNPTKANTNYNTSRSNMANNGLAMPNSLSPDFIATPTKGKAPLVVVFYDQSAGSPTSWYWNFGDGHTSTLQNPAHQYDSVGVYDVTLTISSADGTKSITKFGFIDVLVDGIYSVDNQYSLNVYPNPYRNSTNIGYFLPNNTKVRIEVYSSLGQLVTVIADEEQQAGAHKYEFSASKYGFSDGVYYLRMTIDNKTTTRKLVEVK